MWTIIKYNSKELHIAKNSLKSNLESEPIFYIPKIKYMKKNKNKVLSLEKNILENYMICFHKQFSDTNMLSKLKYLKGLSYFLILPLI